MILVRSTGRNLMSILFRLGGKGARGIHFVTIKVEIPTSVSREEKELLQKLQGMRNKSPFGFGR
jgi:hypothetical protein